MKRLGNGALGCSERIMGISIISYRKNTLDLRSTWVTTSPRERIEFVSQESIVGLLVNSIHLCLNCWPRLIWSWKSSHCTITVDVKASYFCVILDTPACPLAIIWSAAHQNCYQQYRGFLSLSILCLVNPTLLKNKQTQSKTLSSWQPNRKSELKVADTSLLLNGHSEPQYLWKSREQQRHLSRLNNHFARNSYLRL
jgi:hypothetical protein